MTQTGRLLGPELLTDRLIDMIDRIGLNLALRAIDHIVRMRPVKSHLNLAVSDLHRKLGFISIGIRILDRKRELYLYRKMCTIKQSLYRILFHFQRSKIIQM